MRKLIDGGRAAIIVAVGSLLGTSVVAMALAWPNAGAARLLDLSQTHEARADRLVAAAAPTPSDLALSQQETVSSLRQSPANPTAWLRLAYIDSRRPEGLGRSGIDALSRSYDAAPYGPDDTAWRLRFALDHWSRLDRETRLLVLDELRVAIRNRSPAVRGIAQDVSDPAGQLAIQLTLGEAERVRRLDGTTAQS